MSVLTPDEIEKETSKLPVEWAVPAGAELELSLKFCNFAEALEYVNKVGAIAEDMNHHPDISLSYGKVELSVTTHSAGGLTKKDFEFAKAVQEITS